MTATGRSATQQWHSHRQTQPRPETGGTGRGPGAGGRSEPQPLPPKTTGLGGARVPAFEKCPSCSRQRATGIQTVRPTPHADRNRRSRGGQWELWGSPLSGGHDVGRERGLEGQGPLSGQNEQKQQNQAGGHGKRPSDTGCNQGPSRVDRELTGR